tara:strand:+ start:238 stop:381 length:144 start_codon:yes stop_codon:yes gene_type:complete
MVTREYIELTEKLANKTILPHEKKRLFELAFGKKFMASNDKGTIKEY